MKEPGSISDVEAVILANGMVYILRDKGFASPEELEFLCRNPQFGRALLRLAEEYRHPKVAVAKRSDPDGNCRKPGD